MNWRAAVLPLALVFLAVCFAYLCVTGFVLLAGQGGGFDKREAVFFLGLAVATIAVVSIRKQELRQALALSWSNNLRIPILFIAAMIGFTALEGLAISSGWFGSIDEIKAQSPSERSAIGFINAVVLAPVIEEMLFRGFLFTALRERMTFLLALLVSTLAFGLLHIENGLLHVVSVLPAGAFLALAREKSGGIGLPIVLHGLMNLAAVAASLVL